MSRNYPINVVCLLVLGLSLGTIVFGQGVKSPRVPEGRSFYIKNGWIPLSSPDSRFEPGAVFSYDPDSQELKYITSLKACGIPNSVLEVTSSPSEDLPFKNDPFGNVSYKAETLLRFSGVNPGPDFSDKQLVTLAIEDHGAVSLDLLRLNLWVTDPSNAGKISESCRQILSQRNIFVAEEAYQLTHAKYKVVTNKDGLPTRVTDAISFTGSLDSPVQPSSDGSLTFREPVYAAVRHLTPLDGSFQTLGNRGGPSYADPKILSAMTPKTGDGHASARNPQPVYNAVFAPTLPNRPAELIDGKKSSVSFFIGPPDVHSAVDSKNWTVNPQLLSDKQNHPLIVTMTCTFCEAEGVQKKPLTYFGARKSSTRADFRFIPKRRKVKDPSGIGQINFQITQNGIQLDYVVVTVRVNTPTVKANSDLHQRSLAVSASVEQPPPWAREIDLTLSIRSVGGRLQACLDPGPELIDLLNGKHLAPDGTLRWLNTGMRANEVPKLEGQLYLDLVATIRNDNALKSILTGSPSSGQASINDMLLTDGDQQRLVALLAKKTAAWYRDLFITGADDDLRLMMEALRTYKRADRPLRIRVESEGIYLPWQLLIPPSSSIPDAQEFWGFRYELSVNPTGINLPGPYLGPLEYHTGTLVYAQYRSQLQNDAVAQLSREELNVLTKDLGLSGIIPADSQDYFKQSLKDNRTNVRLVVSFTHAENGTIVGQDGQITEDAGGPKLIFADNESLPVANLAELLSSFPANEVSLFPDAPVVFLNGCETGTAGFYATTNQDFAGTFLRMGARGVIVTEAPVWTYFGYNFGVSLLRELKHGTPITAALLSVRKSYLEKLKNPLGLLYTYYGGADVRVNFQ